MKASLLLLALLAPAMLQAQAAGGDAGTKDKRPDRRDPNRIVCEVQEELGSRLKRGKICKPAWQWAEERRGERDWLQKSQSSPCVSQGGC